MLEADRALSDLKRNGMAKAVGVCAKDWEVIQKIDADISISALGVHSLALSTTNPMRIESNAELLNVNNPC